MGLWYIIVLLQIKIFNVLNRSWDFARGTRPLNDNQRVVNKGLTTTIAMSRGHNTDDDEGDEGVVRKPVT
jgi:hypothetical protein